MTDTLQIPLFLYRMIHKEHGTHTNNVDLDWMLQGEVDHEIHRILHITE